MARKQLTGIDLNGQRAQNAADGTSPGDLVTKAQLDAYFRGLKWKNSAKVATTAAITLSGTQTIDGVAVAVGDRVLVKNQATAADNGLYVVASGAWTRATDFDDSVEVTSGSAIPIEQGTANGDSVQILTTDGAITVGTTGLTFTRLGGSGVSYTAGAGLSLTGSTFAVVAKANGGLISDGTGVYIDSTQLASFGVPRKETGNVPSGSTTAAITHSRNTLDVSVDIIEVATGAVVDTDVVATNTTTVTVTFPTAPTSGQYRYIIIG